MGNNAGHGIARGGCDVLVLAALVVLAGCPSGPHGGGNAAPDARVDAVAALDAGADVRTDASSDGGIDANGEDTGDTDANVAHDTWVVTTTTSAPSAREGYTAVWTGTEMIVWGGDDIGRHLNTGGRYTP